VAAGSLASPSTAPRLRAAAPTTPPASSPAPAPSSASTGMFAADAPVAGVPARTSSAPSVSASSSPSVDARAHTPVPHTGSAPSVAGGSTEPLSAGRYRIQFTADAAFKQQLERARDLLRHANPSGDFALILSRALELLIHDLLRRRFAAGARREVASRAPETAKQQPSPAAPLPSRMVTPPPPVTPPPTVTPPSTVTTPAPTRTSHIPRAARRAVLERDGLGCTWTNAHGVRCGSQAWLELDHRHPEAKAAARKPITCGCSAELTISSLPNTPTAASTSSARGGDRGEGTPRAHQHDANQDPRSLQRPPHLTPPGADRSRCWRASALANPRRTAAVRPET
jgi:hypothetical protein